jgi:rhodanese-related sulfurtransferase
MRMPARWKDLQMFGKISAAALCAAALCASAAGAQEPSLTFIATQKLAAETSAPASTWNFTLIDARTRVEYGEAHIQGAQNCPAPQVANLLPLMVPDRERRIVFYCNGPKCTKSQKAARAALALGYRNVIEYNDGLPAWREARLPVVGSPLPAFDPPAVSAEALDEVRTTRQRPLLVDVRDRVEFDLLHIPGSVNIQLDDLHERARHFPLGRSIVLVDHSGHQVPIASRVLNQAGRGASLQKLDGGFLGWQQKKLALVSGSTMATR